MGDELLRLLEPRGATRVAPVAARRWAAGFCDGTLEAWCKMDEAAVVLEPFRLALAGDFVRRSSCPVEAAALSGLEAGARVAQVLMRDNY